MVCKITHLENGGQAYSSWSYSVPMLTIDSDFVLYGKHGRRAIPVVGPGS